MDFDGGCWVCTRTAAASRCICTQWTVLSSLWLLTDGGFRWMGWEKIYSFSEWEAGWPQRFHKLWDSHHIPAATFYAMLWNHSWEGWVWKSQLEAFSLLAVLQSQRWADLLRGLTSSHSRSLYLIQALILTDLWPWLSYLIFLDPGLPSKGWKWWLLEPQHQAQKQHSLLWTCHCLRDIVHPKAEDQRAVKTCAHMCVDACTCVRTYTHFIINIIKCFCERF